MIEFHSLLVISAISFLLTLFLTPVARNAFVGMGILDRPDGDRKLHRHPVPRVGGIPIAFSYVAAYGVLLMLPWRAGSLLAEQIPFITRLLPAALLIFVTGLLDDVYGLRPWQKLAGQLAGAFLAVWAGVRIYALAGYPIPDGWAAAFTMVWLIGCTNAFNLIDGLDGLASGMGLFATVTIFIAALLHGNETLALATLPLAGCLLGFLRYNFNPASVFLGDSGSLLIGFLLGSYGVIWCQKSATLLGMTAPMMALAIPLLDTGLAIVRRWLRGQPIFGADRSHIHHKLLDKGFTHRRVVLLLYLACTVYAVLSLLQSVSTNHYGGLIVILFCLVTWLGIQHLGYFEFAVAGKTLFGGALRRVLNGHITLHGLERNLARCSNVGECWGAMIEVCSQFGFQAVQARLNGSDFSHRGFPEAHRAAERGSKQKRNFDLCRAEQAPLCAYSSEDLSCCWQVRIPLPGGDFINLYGSFDTPGEPAVLLPLVQMLRLRLEARLPGLPQTAPAGVASPPTDVASLLGLAASIESFQPAKIKPKVGVHSAD